MTATKNDSDKVEPSDQGELRGEGVAPYRGYEFQIEATAYLALELMFALRWTTHIDVEPLGGEDIATPMSERAARPAWLTAANPVSLLIQIKSNGTGHWTPAEFRKVIEGKERVPNAKRRQSTRVWPAEALRNDPSVRFLFVTDAQVRGDLSDLRLNELCAASSKGDESLSLSESVMKEELA
jgi:hypothetical protein